MLENLKFVIGSIVVIALLGLAGYWAFSTIETGSTHVNTQKQKELEQKNEDLEKEIADLKTQISIFEADKEQTRVAQEQAQLELDKNKVPEVATPVTPTPTKTTVSKNQTLINELQKLIDNKVYLKLKSQGTQVGTIQKFLNLYNKTSNKVDNDYGASTETTVKAYQKAVGITADGETGPSTYSKMIVWLKNH